MSNRSLLIVLYMLQIFVALLWGRSTGRITRYVHLFVCLSVCLSIRPP